MATFGAKDLALLLPDEVGDAFSMQHTEDMTALKVKDVKAFRPLLDPTKKVKRYVAGQVPQYSANDQSAEDTDGYFGKNRHVEAPEIVGEQNDSRLLRMQKSNIDVATSGPRRRRERVEAEVVMEDDEEADDDTVGDARNASRLESPSSREDPIHNDFIEGDVAMAAAPPQEEAEDEEAIAARRARIREKLRRLRQEEDQEEELLQREEDKPEEDQEEKEEWGAADAEDGDSSEWETGSSESEEESQLMKPVFVSRNKRATILEAERKVKVEETKRKAAAVKLEQRKIETRNMIAEKIRREEQMVENQVGDNDSDDNMPSDTDDLDDPVAYEAWKVRELQRLTRDNAIKEKMKKEKEETERRRALTDEQRSAEDLALGKVKTEEKAKWKFLQKYYHKGAFYMDEEEHEKVDVRQRKYDQPTLEDKFDKAALPRVMQVKKFGFAGQTKYTHLLDQDTTEWDSPWMQNSALRQTTDSKMSGLGDIDSGGRKRIKK